ncbi:MAG: hypothetical protein JWQ71_4953 [Pedosphaera sp.]|nr:hypothetical protein [Pedosphaera sp.]
MSILAALSKRWNYSVESPGSGRLVYHEGNREFTFPVYEEDGVIVLVGAPSSQRIHFFFSWYGHPKEFSQADQDRILPRIEEYLHLCGWRVRVFIRDAQTENFEFHPQLFEQRGRASELLEEAGFTWFSDYSSIDLMHEEYGLEISGIEDERHVKPILAAMQRGFPHWHHHKVNLHEHGREPGWTLAIHMFPSQPCNSESCDES